MQLPLVQPPSEAFPPLSAQSEAVKQGEEKVEELTAALAGKEAEMQMQQEHHDGAQKELEAKVGHRDQREAGS